MNRPSASIDVGSCETAETYDRLVAVECAKMEAALRATAVADEIKPVKIDWTAMTSEKSLLRRSYMGAKK